ncbi:unnamed protein product, partial [Lymnaea stagnalis]
ANQGYVKISFVVALVYSEKYAKVMGGHGVVIVGLLVAVLHLRDGADGNIASYVKQICERIPIHTTAEKTTGDNGFRIIIEGLPTPDTYRPGDTY